jgi:hypothetical protein
MPSEAAIVDALDTLTTVPQQYLESLSPGGRSHVSRLRHVLRTPGVVAIGVSEKTTQGKPTGALALTFYVNRKKPLARMSADMAVPPTVPEPISGPTAIPTDVVAIGRPRLEVSDLARPLVTRTPIQPGFSIGHFKASAGTLGAIVSRDGRHLILSNSHVLAKSGKARKGDTILYPGPDDDGQAPDDAIAELVDFVRFKLGGKFVNQVDCAIAMPLEGRLEELTTVIKGWTVPRGVMKPVRNMRVVKVGRTTGKTEGVVKDVHFRFVLTYPGVGKVGFLDQIFCSRYSNGGDSGALVVDRRTKKAVGLHFAGFPDRHGVMGSVCNPIRAVLAHLRITLATKRLR